MKILAVDDDNSILELLDRILSSSGSCDVVTADSAEAALLAISETHEPFDSVLVDIQMPKTDGIALTRMIRETPGYQHVAIVMLTAMQEKRYLDAAFKAGATDYLTKPFELIDLHRRINAAYATCLGKRDLQHSSVMAGEMKNMGGEAKDIRLDEPASLKDHPASIDAREFENYLAGLSRLRSGPATATAAKIHGIERFYRSKTFEEFLGLITDTATTIKDVILPDDGVMCYRGAGIFLGIAQGKPNATHAQLESRINTRLRETRTASDLEGIHVLVGKPVPLALSSELNAIASLSDAVAEAEDRALSLPFERDFPTRLIGRRHLGAEQDRLDRLAFARLLSDTLPNVEDDAWTRKLKQRARR